MKRHLVKKICYWFILKPLKSRDTVHLRGYPELQLTVWPLLPSTLTEGLSPALPLVYLIQKIRGQPIRGAHMSQKGEILKPRCGNDRRSIVWLWRRSLWVRRRRWLRLPRLQLLQALPRDSHRPPPNNPGWNRQIPLSDIIEIFTKIFASFQRLCAQHIKVLHIKNNIG